MLPRLAVWLALTASFLLVATGQMVTGSSPGSGGTTGPLASDLTSGPGVRGPAPTSTPSALPALARAGSVPATAGGDTPSSASASGGWSALCSTCAPGNLVGPSMAYDEADHYTVLFGGYNTSSGTYSDATWTYEGGTWTELCAICGPAARDYAAMTYDAKDGYLLLFGGLHGGPLADGWTFHGGAWTPLCSPCAPAARWGASMTYDTADGVALLYGGCGATCPMGDAWSYSGGSWSSVCAGACPPPARFNASMTYDPVDGYVVLFGGSSGTSDRPDAWTFHAGSWTSLGTAAPAARSGAAFVFDSTDGFSLLFGGYNASTSSFLSDSWEFLGGAFHALSLPTSPGARAVAGASDDAFASEVLLYGGSSGAGLADAWSFQYGLASGAPTGLPSSIDDGQSVSFSTAVSGGTGPFTYSWNGLPTACLSANSDPLLCTPAGIITNTTFAVVATVGDAHGVLVESPPLNFTVLADPTVGTLGASPASGGADAGQNVSFSVPISGGSGSYTFHWTGLPTGCPSNGGRVVRCVPSGILANTTFTVSVSVNDSNGVTAPSGTLSYIVDSDPSVAAPTISKTSVEVGSTVNFTALAAGGAGSYVWTWTGLPPGCTAPNAPAFSCVPSGQPLNATFLVQARATDANGFATTSTGTSLAVIAAPTLGAPLASPGMVDAGERVNFSVVVAQGVGGYTFHWSGLPAGCTPANSPEISCVPLGSGTNATYRVNVTATDANGVSGASSPLYFMVHSDPSISSLSASPLALDAGGNTTLTVGVFGGSGSYTFQWWGLPPGCVSANSPTLLCGPSRAIAANTSFRVMVNATDAAGFRVSSGPTVIRVSPAPRLSSLWARPSALDGGQMLLLQVNASGGSGGYTFAWWGLPSGCTSPGTSVLNCTPVAGVSNLTYAVWVSVRDSNGGTGVTSPLAIEVDARPTVTSLLARYPNIDAGGPEQFSAKVTFGSGNYTFNWSGLPPGCSAGDFPVLSCAPSTPGSYNVSVLGTDGRGVSSAPATFVLSVVPDLTVVSFYASSSSALTGVNTSFSVVLSGGIAPFAFAYTGLPAGCGGTQGAHPWCDPETAGTYVLVVTVTDARGFSSTDQVSWTVLSRGNAGGLFGLPSPYGFLVLGAVIAVLLLTLFLAIPWLRGASSRDPDGSVPSEEGAESLPPEGGEAASEGAAEAASPTPGSEEAALASYEEGAGEGSPEPVGVAAPSPTEPGTPATTIPIFPTLAASPSSRPPLEPPTPPEAVVPREAPPSSLPELGAPTEGAEAPLPSDLAPLPVEEVRPLPAPAPASSSEPVQVRKCPLCGTPLSATNVCRTCELDWTRVSIQGRTDTLKPKRPQT